MSSVAASHPSVPHAETAERVATALRGRREAALLSLPSVRHMAELLAIRCRELSWVRTAVATLDRFRVLTGEDDLEDLLATGRRDRTVAEATLRQLAASLDGRAPEQVAALGFGAKLWWRTNGVPVAWRPLTARRTEAAPSPLRATSGLPTLALIGSGLTAEELGTVRIADLGALDDRARVVPDLLADPLAVRYLDGTDRREWVAFLSPAARECALARFAALAENDDMDHGEPLVAPEDLARARGRDAALIGTGNDVNVTLCLATGDFFRAWGMPGARFEQRARDEAARAVAPGADITTETERRPR